MAQQTMQYKGCTAISRYSEEDKCLVGEVSGIDHIIAFRGNTREEIIANFRDMIDDYPAACIEQGLEPNQPPSEIMVPIPTELYAKATCKAELEGQTPNRLISRAIENLVA